MRVVPLLMALVAVCATTWAQVTSDVSLGSRTPLRLAQAWVSDNAIAAVTLQVSNPELGLTISADKQQAKPGENVTLTLKVRNNLQPIPPIELTATATYTDLQGQQKQATSNTVVIRVVQPITVSNVTLSLPVGWEFVTGSSPVQFGVELIEGQEATRQVVIRRISR